MLSKSVHNPDCNAVLGLLAEPTWLLFRTLCIHEWDKYIGCARWLVSEQAKAMQVCAEEHQRYLLFSSLLRHTGISGMSSAQQAALVDLAAAEGRALEGGLASPALVLAVKVCCSSLLTAVSVCLVTLRCIDLQPQYSKICLDTSVESTLSA